MFVISRFPLQTLKKCIHLYPNNEKKSNKTTSWHNNIKNRYLYLFVALLFGIRIPHLILKSHGFSFRAIKKKSTKLFFCLFGDYNWYLKIREIDEFACKLKFRFNVVNNTEKELRGKGEMDWNIKNTGMMVNLKILGIFHLENQWPF